MADINKWFGALKIGSFWANQSRPAQQWFKSRLFVSLEDVERQFTIVHLLVSVATKFLFGNLCVSEVSVVTYPSYLKKYDFKQHHQAFNYYLILVYLVVKCILI